MIFSGQNFLSLPEVDSLSFNIPFSVDSINETGCFGFSGSGANGQEIILNFKLSSGEIKDFNNNYVYSYYPNKEINISGDIFSGGHIYYINNNPFSLSGTQEYFKFKRFFYDSEFNIESDASISVSPPTLTLNTPDFFDISGAYTGAIEKNYNFNIFSANIEGSDSKSFVMTQTDLNSTNNTGSFTLSTGSNYSGIFASVNYQMLLNFETDVGNIQKVLEFTGINFSKGDVGISNLTTTRQEIDIESTSTPLQKSVNSYKLGYVFSKSGISQERPIGVELSYYAGNTGLHSGFTGDINIIYGGSGYSSGNNPIYATGADGSGFIGDLLSDANFRGTFYYVSGESGINLINSGSGYSGTGPTEEHLFNIKGGHLSAQSQSGLSGLSGFFSTGHGSTYSEKINNTASGWPIVDSYSCDGYKVYQVTGFYMFNSGKYLNEIPTLTFSGTHHYNCTKIQTATATTSLSGSGDFSQGSGSITGILVLNSGENYTGKNDLFEYPHLAYTGQGTGANIEPVMFSYDKHFFESWDLKTGYDLGSLYSFSGASYTGTDNVSVTRFVDTNYGEGVSLLNSSERNFYIQVENIPYWDTGHVIGKLRITGQDFDFVKYITGSK